MVIPPTALNFRGVTSSVAESRVSFRSVNFRQGAPAHAMQISPAWRWSCVNEVSGMSAAQPIHRCGLTIAGLPLHLKARIWGGTADRRGSRSALGLTYRSHTSRSDLCLTPQRIFFVPWLPAFAARPLATVLSRQKSGGVRPPCGPTEPPRTG